MRRFMNDTTVDVESDGLADMRDSRSLWLRFAMLLIGYHPCWPGTNDGFWLKRIEATGART